MMVRAGRDLNFVVIKTKLRSDSDIFHTNTRHFYIPNVPHAARWPTLAKYLIGPNSSLI